MDKVRTLTRRASHRTLADLLRRFSYIDHFAFWRIVGWLKKRHPKLKMRTLVRRHLPGWQIRDQGIENKTAP